MAFTDRDRDVLLLFAIHASLALTSQDNNIKLRELAETLAARPHDLNV